MHPYSLLRLQRRLPWAIAVRTNSYCATTGAATVKAFHYENLESLKAHVLAFVTAYNFAKHLKALRWRTPFQAIQEAWTKDPSPFKINPHQLIPRPNN